MQEQGICINDSLTVKCQFDDIPGYILCYSQPTLYKDSNVIPGSWDCDKNRDCTFSGPVNISDNRPHIFKCIQRWALENSSCDYKLKNETNDIVYEDTKTLMAQSKIFLSVSWIRFYTK